MIEPSPAERDRFVARLLPAQQQLLETLHAADRLTAAYDRAVNLSDGQVAFIHEVRDAERRYDAARALSLAALED